MIEILKEGEKGVVRISKPARGCWINVVEPTEAELKQLNNITEIPHSVITSIRDVEENPDLEKYPGMLFVLIRTPIERRDEKELRYSTRPLGILITKKYFVTISYEQNTCLEKFKTQVTSLTGIQPLLNLFLVSGKVYLKSLSEIKTEMYATQENLERATKNEEILQLLELQKSLIYFSTSLRSNQLILERLNKEVKGKTNLELYENSLEEYKQAISMSKIYSYVIATMMDAFGTVISNNLNQVIKTLTSITIILMIPTLVASIYGMNVELPFQRSPDAFLITMLISVAVSLFGVVFFWRKELF